MATILGVCEPKTNILLRNNDDFFIKYLQKEFGYILGEISQVSLKTTFPIKLTTSNDLIKKNILLFGNAANTLHPIFGQNFNLNIKDMMTLCKLLEMRASPRQVLQNYCELRKKDHKKILNFTHLVVKTFAGKDLSRYLGNFGIMFMQHHTKIKNLLVSTLLN